MNKDKINKIFSFFERFKMLNKKEKDFLIKQLNNNKTLKPLNTAFNISIELFKLKGASEIDKHIYVALFCLGIEGFTDDPRGNIAILGLLNSSANKLGRDLNIYIKELKDFFGDDVTKYFDNWIERDDKSIENFGFKEIKDKHGKFIDYDTNNLIFHK